MKKEGYRNNQIIITVIIIILALIIGLFLGFYIGKYYNIVCTCSLQQLDGISICMSG